jgi:hypothetical protein
MESCAGGDDGAGPKRAGGGSGEDAEAMREFLESIAGAMGAAENTSRASEQRTDDASSGDAGLLNDIKRNCLRSADQHVESG